MIASSTLPSAYVRWNKRWRAPFGRKLPFGGSLAWSRPMLWYRGPFAFQPNNVTRQFEYPWAHAQIRSRMSRGTVVEIGGGMSGLQFVLAREGYDVINVDPGLQARGHGWPAAADDHRYLSRLFRAPARLVPTTLDQADLPPASADIVVSISTLEHLTPDDLLATAYALRRTLKPNGCVVLTVDLFLGLAPFTATTRNQWGTNIDVYAFLQHAGLELVEGDPRQIHGFPEFDITEIVRNRESFLVGSASTVVQCVVGRPSGSVA